MGTDGKIGRWLRVAAVAVAAACGLLSSCQAERTAATFASGEQIVAAGQRLSVGTPVVLWSDPGGYDAYQPLAAPGDARAQAAVQAAEPSLSFGVRGDRLPVEQQRQLQQSGWDLPALQQVVDQVVIHYDACATSQQCFRVLQERGLSAHFLIDIDGTIYQTLDLKERAWHATVANDRSIGIEIANLGAYPPEKADLLDGWYQLDAQQQLRLVLPAKLGDGGVRTQGFVAQPARRQRIEGTIHGRPLQQHDFTAEQYEALARLIAGLCRIFPLIAPDYPRDGAGHLLTRQLQTDELARFRGVLGHYHVQANKEDPGPAFQWDRVLGRAPELMRSFRRSQRFPYEGG